jgi:hypothetical protein
MSIILFHQNMVSKTTTIFDFKTTQTTKIWQSNRLTFSRNKTDAGLFLEPGARQSLCKIMATVPLSRSAVKKPDPALSSCRAVVYRSPGTG